MARRRHNPTPNHPLGPGCARLYERFVREGLVAPEPRSATLIAAKFGPPQRDRVLPPNLSRPDGRSALSGVLAPVAVDRSPSPPRSWAKTAGFPPVTRERCTRSTGWPAPSAGVTTVGNWASTSWATARFRRSGADAGGTAARSAGERSARTRGQRTAAFAGPFPPFPSKQPRLRYGGQDIRVVVPDTVHPGADGAPLVWAGMGLTEQLKEAGHRR